MNSSIRSKNDRRVIVCVAVLACSAWVCLGQAQEVSRKIIKKVEAQYPTILKQRGIGGVVKLKVFILANGKVKDTEVLGGNAILAVDAQKAVQQWVFAPAVADSTMEVSVVFDPHASSE